MHHLLRAAPSVLFDAVALLPSEAEAARLAEDRDAQQFVVDAFRHEKFVAFGRPATAILDTLALVPDDGCVELSDRADAARFVDLLPGIRSWGRTESGLAGTV